jgi:hypothetical protein
MNYFKVMNIFEKLTLHNFIIIKILNLFFKLKTKISSIHNYNKIS